MGPIEAEKAESTRRSELHYRRNSDSEYSHIEVYGGVVTCSVKLLCRLSGETDPFPDSSEDVHLTRIDIEHFNSLMEKAGFEIVRAEHKWV